MILITHYVLSTKCRESLLIFFCSWINIIVCGTSLWNMQSFFMVGGTLTRGKKSFFPKRKLTGFKKLLLGRGIQLPSGKSAQWQEESHKGVSRSAFHMHWNQYTVLIRNTCCWKGMSIQMERKPATYSSGLEISISTPWLYTGLFWEVLRNTDSWVPVLKIQI